MGPERTAETIRKALSMGADAGVHLVDDSLHGSDAVATSYALSKVIEKQGADIVMFGSESTDARMSVVPAMVAERLGLPQLTFAGKVEVDGTNVTINRRTEYGYDVVEASTPVVISVVEKINEPRYPSFKGIMAAKKKPVETLSVADAGIDAAQVGGGASWTVVESFADRPAKAKGQVVTDDGNGGAAIAEYLVAQKLI
jgi:electron transfer flavoprotein beta subunit